MISSELIPIELRNANTKEVIWRNEMVNSPYGVCPLRLAFEKESEGMYILCLKPKQFLSNMLSWQH